MDLSSNNNILQQNPCSQEITFNGDFFENETTKFGVNNQINIECYDDSMPFDISAKKEMWNNKTNSDDFTNSNICSHSGNITYSPNSTLKMNEDVPAEGPSNLCEFLLQSDAEKIQNPFPKGRPRGRPKGTRNTDSNHKAPAKTNGCVKGNKKKRGPYQKKRPTQPLIYRCHNKNYYLSNQTPNTSEEPITLPKYFKKSTKGVKKLSKNQNNTGVEQDSDKNPRAEVNVPLVIPKIKTKINAQSKVIRKPLAQWVYEYDNGWKKGTDLGDKITFKILAKVMNPAPPMNFSNCKNNLRWTKYTFINYDVTFYEEECFRNMLENFLWLRYAKEFLRLHKISCKEISKSALKSFVGHIWQTHKDVRETVIAGALELPDAKPMINPLLFCDVGPLKKIIEEEKRLKMKGRNKKVLRKVK